MPLYHQGQTQGRTTLLEAVNVLMENIGEQPVDSLNDQQVQDARTAERTLLELHKEGQIKGWSWNTEYAYPFERDASTHEIVVPDAVVRFAPDPYHYAGRFQLRGKKVYDTWERTTKLKEEVPEVCADVIWLLGWDDVPEAFNRWTTIRAARVFGARVLGDDGVVKYTQYDEMQAQAVLERMEQEQVQANILTGGQGYRPFPTYQPAAGLATRRIGAAWRL